MARGRTGKEGRATRLEHGVCSCGVAELVLEEDELAVHRAEDPRLWVGVRERGMWGESRISGGNRGGSGRERASKRCA